MYNEKRVYEYELAKELLDDFNSRIDYDLTIKSRKPKISALKSLLYVVLSRKANMTDRCICEFLNSNNMYSVRSSICASRNKIDDYYKELNYIRRIYDIYFDDKSEIFLIDKKLNHLKIREAAIEKKKKDIIASDDFLVKLVRDVPKERRREVYDLIELRIKSWSWKTNDKCDIYEGQTLNWNV